MTPEAVAAVAAGRHRRHRFPARRHVVKGAVRRGGTRRCGGGGGAGWSSYQRLCGGCGAGDGAAGPGADRAGRGRGAGGPAGRRVPVSLSSPEDRELLAELIQARLALRRFGVNVNQAAAVLNSGGEVPVWLEQAVAGGDRAVARVDRAAVARRLGWAPAPGGDRSGAAARQLGAGVAVLRVHRGPGGRGGTGERAHATLGHRWLGRRGRAGGAAATGVRRRAA